MDNQAVIGGAITGIAVFIITRLVSFLTTSSKLKEFSKTQKNHNDRLIKIEEKLMSLKESTDKDTERIISLLNKINERDN